MIWCSNILDFRPKSYWFTILIEKICVKSQWNVETIKSKPLLQTETDLHI